MANIRSRSWSSLVDTSTACTHCGDAATKRCGKCKNARYCSEECQAADWALHKSLCASWDEFKERLNPDVRRVIVLGEDAKKPRFAWMRVRVSSPEAEDSDYEDDSSSHPFGVPTFDPPTENSVLGEYDDFMDYSSPQMYDLIVGSKGHGELLDHGIAVVGGSSYVFDGSAPNLCIDTITDGKCREMCGPFFFHGTSKVNDSTVCLDLDTNDLTLAVDALIDWRCKRGSYSFLQPRPLKKVMGVKVVKDDTLGKDGLLVWKYEEVQVPVKHPVFSEGSELDLSASEGRVLMTYSLGKRPTGEAFKPQHIRDVNPAVFLYSTQSNLPRQQWTDRSMLIVEPKKKRLDKLLIQDMCRLAIEKL